MLLRVGHLARSISGRRVGWVVKSPLHAAGCRSMTRRIALPSLVDSQPASYSSRSYIVTLSLERCMPSIGYCLMPHGPFEEREHCSLF